MCERFIPVGLLSGKPVSRRRCFPLSAVFWAFLPQVLTRTLARRLMRRVVTAVDFPPNNVNGSENGAFIPNIVWERVDDVITELFGGEILVRG